MAFRNVYDYLAMAARATAERTQPVLDSLHKPAVDREYDFERYNRHRVKLATAHGAFFFGPRHGEPDGLPHWLNLPPVPDPKAGGPSDEYFIEDDGTLACQSLSRGPGGGSCLVAEEPGKRITRLFLAYGDPGLGPKRVMFMQGVLDDGSALPPVGSPEGCTDLVELATQGCFTMVSERWHPETHAILLTLGDVGPGSRWRRRRRLHNGRLFHCASGHCIVGYVAAVTPSISSDMALSDVIRSGMALSEADEVAHAASGPLHITFLEGPIPKDVKKKWLWPERIWSRTVVLPAWAARGTDPSKSEAREAASLAVAVASNAADDCADTAAAAAAATSKAIQAAAAAVKGRGATSSAAAIKEAAADCAQAVAKLMKWVAAAKDAAAEAVRIEQECQKLDASIGAVPAAGTVWGKATAAQLQPQQHNSAWPAEHHELRKQPPPVMLLAALKLLQDANSAVLQATDAMSEAVEQVSDQVGDLEVLFIKFAPQEDTPPPQPAGPLGPLATQPQPGGGAPKDTSNSSSTGQANFASARESISKARKAATELGRPAADAVSTVKAATDRPLAAAEHLKALKQGLPGQLLDQARQLPGGEPSDRKQPGGTPLKQRPGEEPPDLNQPLKQCLSEEGPDLEQPGRTPPQQRLGEEPPDNDLPVKKTAAAGSRLLGQRASFRGLASTFGCIGKVPKDEPEPGSSSGKMGGTEGPAAAAVDAPAARTGSAAVASAAAALAAGPAGGTGVSAALAGSSTGEQQVASCAEHTAGSSSYKKAAFPPSAAAAAVPPAAATAASPSSSDVKTEITPKTASTTPAAAVPSAEAASSSQQLAAGSSARSDLTAMGAADEALKHLLAKTKELQKAMSGFVEALVVVE